MKSVIKAFYRKTKKGTLARVRSHGRKVYKAYRAKTGYQFAKKAKAMGIADNVDLKDYMTAIGTVVSGEAHRYTPKNTKFFGGKPKNLDALAKSWAADAKAEAMKGKKGTFKHDQIKMSGMMAHYFEDEALDFFEKTGKVYSLKDGNDVLALAYATPSKGSLFVDALMTNPKAFHDPRWGVGAGSTSMQNLIGISKKMGYDGAVTLRPLGSSQGFYEKIGFEPLPNDKDNTFILTAEKARKYMRKKGFANFSKDDEIVEYLCCRGAMTQLPG